MKVTPESDVPIIPKATIYQGDDLFPKKKDSFSSFFPVKRISHKEIKNML